MHASNVALLFLAASAAAPVLAVPLPHFNARSEDGVAAVNKRDPSKDYSDNSPNPTTLRGEHFKQVATRGMVEDFAIALSNTPKTEAKREIQARSWLDSLVSTFESFILRDTTPDELVARDMNSFLAKVLHSRDIIPEQEIQARSWLDSLVSTFESFILRDTTPDELVARDMNSFLTKVLQSRDFNPEQAMQARALVNFLPELIKTIFSRDATPDELPSEPVYDLDQFTEDYILSRNIPDSTSENMARDNTTGGTDEFLKALLESRDSKNITPEGLLKLAALASRALDDLD